MRPPQLPKPTQGFSKFKRFSFKAKPTMQQARFGYSGGGVSGDGGPGGTWIDGHFYSSGDNSPHGQGPDGSIPNFDPNIEPTPIPSSTPNPYGNPDPNVSINQYPSGSTNYTPPMDIPLGPYPGLPGVMPDGSYRGPGSGYPTSNAVGGLVGLGSNLLLPGSGMITGPLTKILMRLAQGPVGKAPGQPDTQTPLTPAPPAAGQPGEPSGYNPFGGLPPGFTEGNRDYNNLGGPNENTQTGGAPDFRGPGDFGPGWVGGSIFGGRGSPIVPGSGFLNNGGNSGSMPTLGGGRSDYGADQALHSQTFRNAIQNMGYKNLAQFQNQTGFTLTGSKLGSGAGVGGGLKPMTSSYAGGGVAGQDEAQATPQEMAELYAMIVRDNEQKRREAMNESPQRNRDIEPDLMQQIAAQPRGSTSISFARGGMVPSVPRPMQVQGMGSDTVPAALTPGELVLNKKQQAAVMPRPGMKSKLKPAELAAIEIAIRNKKRQGLA